LDPFNITAAAIVTAVAVASVLPVLLAGAETGSTPAELLTYLQDSFAVATETASKFLSELNMPVEGELFLFSRLFCGHVLFVLLYLHCKCIGR
jgi:phospholipid N-methyltransferase